MGSYTLGLSSFCVLDGIGSLSSWIVGWRSKEGSCTLGSCLSFVDGFHTGSSFFGWTTQSLVAHDVWNRWFSTRLSSFVSRIDLGTNLLYTHSFSWSLLLGNHSLFLVRTKLGIFECGIFEKHPYEPFSKSSIDSFLGCSGSRRVWKSFGCVVLGFGFV